VPVATEVRGVGRDHDEVPDPGPDVLMAAGADVGLHRLERLDTADLDRPVQRGISAHSSSPATTASAVATIT
jgi:hypothetical protein